MASQIGIKSAVWCKNWEFLKNLNIMIFVVVFHLYIYFINFSISISIFLYFCLLVQLFFFLESLTLTQYTVMTFAVFGKKKVKPWSLVLNISLLFPIQFAKPKLEAIIPIKVMNIQHWYMVTAFIHPERITFFFWNTQW